MVLWDDDDTEHLTKVVVRRPKDFSGNKASLWARANVSHMNSVCMCEFDRVPHMPIALVSVNYFVSSHMYFIEPANDIHGLV